MISKAFITIGGKLTAVWTAKHECTIVFATFDYVPFDGSNVIGEVRAVDTLETTVAMGRQVKVKTFFAVRNEVALVVVAFVGVWVALR